MENKRQTGMIKEEVACTFLEKQGYQIIERNFRSRIGEIDIIASEGEYLVFIEVKYRKTKKLGSPEEAVNKKKQATICKVADYYRKTKWIPDSQSCRFDVVAISGEKEEEIVLYKNSFEYINNWSR